MIRYSVFIILYLFQNLENYETGAMLMFQFESNIELMGCTDVKSDSKKQKMLIFIGGMPLYISCTLYFKSKGTFIIKTGISLTVEVIFLWLLKTGYLSCPLSAVISASDY